MNFSLQNILFSFILTEFTFNNIKLRFSIKLCQFVTYFSLITDTVARLQESSASKNADAAFNAHSLEIVDIAKVV